MVLKTRRSSRKMRLAALLLGLSLALSLGGCYERGGLGPASLSVSDAGLLLVAVCGDFELNEIYGEYRADGGWHTFVDLKGRTLFGRETVLETGVEVSGMHGSVDPFDVSATDAISIRFEGDGSEQVSFNASFSGTSGLGLSAGSWLQSDGAVRAEPCV